MAGHQSFSYRTKGSGSVGKRQRTGLMYWAYEPQTKGEPRVRIGAFETRHAAHRALNAWHVVQALAWLGSLGTTCESLSA